MGRDNQQRDRQRMRIERKTGRRAQYDRLLIVCEGEKTEPNYFNEIRRRYRLSSANVQAMPSKYGTLPQQIVDYAYDCCKENNRWEKVFCVFDKDDHPNFTNAIDSAMSKAKEHKLQNDQGQKIDFYVIPSVPCFELWFLLHFEKVNTEIERRDLLKKLKKHMPEYEKNGGDHFARTEAYLATAFINADMLSENRKDSHIQNPFTAVDEVVKALMKLAGQAK